MDDVLLQRISATQSSKSEKICKEVITLPKGQEETSRFIEYYPTTETDKIMQFRSGPFTQELTTDGIRVSGEPPIIRSGDEDRVIRISPLNCELIYLREGMVYTWINRLTGYHLAAQPEIVCGDTREQEIMDSIIPKKKLRIHFKHLFDHCYIYGNHILKWNFEGNKIIGLTWIDPKYFDAVRDSDGKVKYESKGNPVGYVQYLKFHQSIEGIPEDRIITQIAPWEYQSGRGILFEPEEVVHFKLNSIGDSWWGVGLLEPIYNATKIKQNADEGFGEMMQRTGFPRIVGYCGDQTHPPTQEQIDDIWRKMSDLHTKHQFVAPYYYKFEILESDKPDRFKHNLSYFQNLIVSGLGGPKPFITGLGEDTNRATLNDQKLWLERDLKNQQQDISTQFEDKVLKEIAKQYKFRTIPVIKWTEVSAESLTSKAERLAIFAKAGLLESYPKLTQYIRGLENLPDNGE